PGPGGRRPRPGRRPGPARRPAFQVPQPRTGWLEPAPGGPEREAPSREPAARAYRRLAGEPGAGGGRPCFPVRVAGGGAFVAFRDSVSDRASLCYGQFRECGRRPADPASQPPWIEPGGRGRYVTRLWLRNTSSFAALESTTSRTSRSGSPAIDSPSSPDSRARANPRWRSTRFTPRDSAG